MSLLLQPLCHVAVSFCLLQSAGTPSSRPELPAAAPRQPAASQPAPATTPPVPWTALEQLPPPHRLYANPRLAFEQREGKWMVFETTADDLKSESLFGDGPGFGAVDCLKRLNDVNGLLVERVEGQTGHVHLFVLLCDEPASALPLITGRIREIHARLETGLAFVKASRLQVEEVEVAGTDLARVATWTVTLPREKVAVRQHWFAAGRVIVDVNITNDALTEAQVRELFAELLEVIAGEATPIKPATRSNPGDDDASTKAPGDSPD